MRIIPHRRRPHSRRCRALTHIAAEGHCVDWVSRLDTAHDYMESARYDLVLLDLMLPDGQGLSLLA